MSSKKENENLVENINLSKYEFKQITYLDKSDNIEIYNKGITFVFGGNGVGKTTIAKNIKNNDYEDKFDYFSYEDNQSLKGDELIISKNQNKIDNVNEEIKKINFDINQRIIELFHNRLKIFIRSPINSYIIKNQNIKRNFLYENYVLAKNKKKLEIDFLDLSILNNIKKTMSKITQNGDLNNLLKKFEDINKFDYETIKKLRKFLQLHKNKREKQKNKINNIISKIVKENELIPIKEDLYDFLINEEKLNNIKKCILCNNEIDSWESVMNSMKAEIKNYYKEIKEKNIINNIEELISQSDLIKNELKLNKKHISSDIFNLFLYKLDHFFNVIDNLWNELEKILELIELEIINIFLLKKGNISYIDYLINNLKQIEEWNEEKIISDSIKDEYNVIFSFIEEKIGKNRISVDYDKKAIIVNNSPISTSDQLNDKLSTGQKKFITFCFSLIFTVLKNKEKIIIIDDPFSSYDSENEYNVIYIINYFANNGIKFLIFTHNWYFLSTHYMSNLYKCKNRIDNYYIIEKSFFNKKQLFMVKKILTWKNGEKKEFINAYFSNNDFVKWLRKENLHKINDYYKKNINNNKTKEQHFLKEYAYFITSILPIIRGFLKIIGIDNSKIINNLMHYFNFSNFNDNDTNEMIKHLFIFFNLNNDDMEKINDLYKKVIKQMFCVRNNFIWKYDMNSEVFSNNLLYYQLNKLYNILIMRRKLEEILLKKLNRNFSDNDNIYRLTCECEKKQLLNKEDSIIIKSKRVFINCFSHLERLNNYIIPLFEIDKSFFKTNFKFILKIK